MEFELVTELSRVARFVKLAQQGTKTQGTRLFFLQMLLVVSFLFFGACVVSSSPVERRYSNQVKRKPGRLMY